MKLVNFNDLSSPLPPSKGGALQLLRNTSLFNKNSYFFSGRMLLSFGGAFHFPLWRGIKREDIYIRSLKP
jgi:hypothetical protein